VDCIIHITAIEIDVHKEISVYLFLRFLKL